jgi:hypothetical protein
MRPALSPPATLNDRRLPMEEFMRVLFVEKVNGPERLVCDAEIVFDEGELAGMKLVGFAVWRGAEGDTYVTFPSRAFGTATDRKYFDYLRSVEPGAAGSRRVKDWILDAYRNDRSSNAA